MVGIGRGGGGREEWRGTGLRGKETLASGLILEVNLACVASVSSRVRRESWDESKKKKNGKDGGGEGE